MCSFVNSSGMPSTCNEERCDLNWIMSGRSAVPHLIFDVEGGIYLWGNIRNDSDTVTGYWVYL